MPGCCGSTRQRRSHRPLLAILFLAANLLVRTPLKRAGDELGNGFEERIAVVQENVGAMRELILAGPRDAAAERFRQVDHRLAEALARIQVAIGVPRIMVESLGLAALALVAWGLAEREGSVAAALPTLAALSLGAQRLLPLLQTVNHSVNALTAAGTIQARMAAILAEPDLDHAPPPPTLPFKAKIRLEGVGFDYPRRDRPALEAIDLVIRRGERIVLTGPNGSGKSTQADLVMGLLEPSRGQVLVDGGSLTRANATAWQRNVAHVPSSPAPAWQRISPSWTRRPIQTEWLRPFGW